MDKNNYKTVKQYSKQEGISVQGVYKRIKKGKVEAVKIGEFTIIKLNNDKK